MDQGRRAVIIAYIMCSWFVISFVTNILGPLMPVVIKDFSLSLKLGGFLPASFFFAYGVVSIPAGMMVERIGANATLLIAFSLNLAGSLAIALQPSYMVVVGSLFVVGAGMAMLQVVINPLTRFAGGEPHFAFFSVMGQLVFGLASYASPLVFAALMRQAALPAGERGGPMAHLLAVSPQQLPWIGLYWLFAALFCLAILGAWLVRIPAIELKDEERTGARGSIARCCASAT